MSKTGGKLGIEYEFFADGHEEKYCSPVENQNRTLEVTKKLIGHRLL